MPMAEEDEILEEILSDDGKAAKRDEPTVESTIAEDGSEAGTTEAPDIPSPPVPDAPEAPADSAPAKKMDIGGAIGMLPDVFKAIGDIPNESADRPENKLEPHAHLLLLFMIVIVLGTVIAFVGNYLGI